MFAEEAIDEKEGIVNAEGMVPKGLGDHENYLVHQAEDVNDSFASNKTKNLEFIDKQDQRFRTHPHLIT